VVNVIIYFVQGMIVIPTSDLTLLRGVNKTVVI